MALSADCTSLVFEAVNEESMCKHKLQLAKRRFSEIQLLTSLAQSNEEGETPLVIAMKGKNVSFIAELVNWISAGYLKKEYVSHQKKIIEQLSPHIPVVIKIIDFHYNKLHFLRFIAGVIIKSTSFTRQDKITTLELIGAAIVLSSVPDGQIVSHSVLIGLEFWREAMTLRHFPRDGGPSIPKAVCVPSEAFSVVFGSTVEVMTMEELDVLKEEFLNFRLSDRNVKYLIAKRFKIQAFLAIRRIPILANLRHPFWLYLINLMDYAKDLLFSPPLATRSPPFELISAEERKITINIYLLILEQLNGFDPNLLSFQTFDVLFETLHLLGKTFHKMLIQETEEITYTYLLAPSKCITTIQGCDHLTYYEHLHLDKLVCHFLWVLNAISPRLTKQEKQKLEKYYHVYMKNSPERTSTVLHAATILSMPQIYGISYADDLYDIPFYASYRVPSFHIPFVNLILKLGADPNAIDQYGQTPLHILAKLKKQDWNNSLFRMLVDAGTHLDTAADDGKTVLSILKKAIHQAAHLPTTFYTSTCIPYLKALVSTVLPLSCYAALVIRRNGIPYNQLPPRLQKLVSRQSRLH